MTILQPSYPALQSDMAIRSLAQISDLIVHHTAGPLSQTALDIDAEHRAEGWAMIGYNFVITPDGKVWRGRDMHYVPAAAYGRNLESVNVVLVGNFQSDDAGYTGRPTAEQISSLTQFCTDLHKQLPSIVRTIGHREVALLLVQLGQISSAETGNYSTACPGDQLVAQLPSVKQSVLASIRKVMG